MVDVLLLDMPKCGDGAPISPSTVSTAQVRIGCE